MDMKNSSKWILGIVFIFVGLGGLIYNFSKVSDRLSDSSKTNGSTPQTLNPPSEHWTEVYTFKGNGLKKSPVFELTGSDARLKYKYKGQGGVGMGMFAVYVVNEGQDIMKTGGFPEVMTQAESEESESTIQKGSGRYYLNVNAVGSWTVTVEEKK